MRRVVLALTILAAAGLVASASGATGFQRHAVPAQGISLAVPASWIVVDSSFSQTLIDRVSQQNPKLAPYIAQLGQPGSPMKFLALDPAVRHAFATNVNVVVAPARRGTTFAHYTTALLAGLRAIASGLITKRVVTIGGAKALRVSYRFRFAFGQMRTVQTLQYAFVRGPRTIVVTYTTLPVEATRYAPTFQQSAASIRFAR
jgi:hypothetical protein